MNQNTNNKKGQQYKGKKRPNWRSGGYKKKKSSVEAKYKCPICEEGVKELGNAIDYKGLGPAHFDCVLREVSQAETLKPGEKVVYIGSGRFGIINNKKNESGVPFTLTKEIDFEDRDLDISWRNERKIDVSVQDK